MNIFYDLQFCIYFLCEMQLNNLYVLNNISISYITNKKCVLQMNF